tara:strand:- start:915 stop:1841 length:927 start_codon:yes stop_codon:yes gene_type:complete
MINKNSKIFIAGATGMVGSSLKRIFLKKKFNNVLSPSRKSLNLLDQKKVFRYLKYHKPDIVFLAAGYVGGININNINKANFIYENLQIQNNVIHGSHLADIQKLFFMGSSCIYPKFSKQPIKESELLNGKLEQTNEPYAVAKIAGVKLCQSYNFQYKREYISIMPPNLYGPNDNYNLETAHVLPALIRKTYEAKKNNKTYIEIWGNGKSLREFMHVDDLAEACLFLLKQKNLHDIINVGSGIEINILNLLQIIMKIAKVNLKITKKIDMPNGTPRKILDSSYIKKLGWKPKISLKNGLKTVYLKYNTK